MGGRCLACLVALLVGLGCSSRDAPTSVCLPGIDCPEDAGPDGPPSEMDAGPEEDAATLEDAGEPDTGPEDAGPLTGESYLYVLDLIDVGAPDPAGPADVVPGFDLDGRVSDATDLAGCRKVDVTSPPPDSLMGVDNALGPVLAQLEDMFFIRQNLESSVSSGQLLVMFEVRGVDDLVDDDRVEIDALFGLLPAGVTRPRLDLDGHYAPDQTFDVDVRSLMDDMETANVTMMGRIVDGRLRGGPADFDLIIPFMDMTIRLNIHAAQVRFDMGDDGIARGVLGGGLEVEETAASLGATGFDESVTRLVLNGAADLEPDERNRCQSVSVGLVFRGVPANKGAVVTP